MRWVKVQKDPLFQPQTGTYKEWKQYLADEAINRCVYCAIHENSMGGIRVFHVEHFRPRSKFQGLLNSYSNLFYVCPICNMFKGNDWPNEPVNDQSIPSYLDPSEVDYNIFFEVSISNGKITGKTIATKYITEKLYLNRPQLITERRIIYLWSEIHNEIDKVRDLLRTIPDDSIYRRMNESFVILQRRWEQLSSRLRVIPKYSLEETRRNG